MAIEQIERLPDVSFIDEDINLDGIQKQMLQDYQDKYMEETGEETVLDRGEPIALILYACSVQIYQMYMYVDRAGKQNLLKYAFGAFLEPGSTQGHRENCRQASDRDDALHTFRGADRSDSNPGRNQSHGWRGVLHDR